MNKIIFFLLFFSLSIYATNIDIKDSYVKIDKDIHKSIEIKSDFVEKTGKVSSAISKSSNEKSTIFTSSSLDQEYKEIDGKTKIIYTLKSKGKVKDSSFEIHIKKNETEKVYLSDNFVYFENRDMTYDFSDIPRDYYSNIEMTSFSDEVVINIIGIKEFENELVLDPYVGSGTLQNCVANGYTICTVDTSSTIGEGLKNYPGALLNFTRLEFRGATITLQLARLNITAKELVFNYSRVNGAGDSGKTRWYCADGHPVDEVGGGGSGGGLYGGSGGVNGSNGTSGSYACSSGAFGSGLKSFTGYPFGTGGAPDICFGNLQGKGGDGYSGGDAGHKEGTKASGGSSGYSFVFNATRLIVIGSNFTFSGGFGIENDGCGGGGGGGGEGLAECGYCNFTYSWFNFSGGRGGTGCSGAGGGGGGVEANKYGDFVAYGTNITVRGGEAGYDTSGVAGTFGFQANISSNIKHFAVHYPYDGQNFITSASPQVNFSSYPITATANYTYSFDDGITNYTMNGDGTNFVFDSQGTKNITFWANYSDGLILKDVIHNVKFIFCVNFSDTDSYGDFVSVSGTSFTLNKSFSMCRGTYTANITMSLQGISLNCNNSILVSSDNNSISGNSSVGNCSFSSSVMMMGDNGFYNNSLSNISWFFDYKNVNMTLNSFVDSNITFSSTKNAIMENNSFRNVYMVYSSTTDNSVLRNNTLTNVSLYLNTTLGYVNTIDKNALENTTINVRAHTFYIENNSAITGDSIIIIQPDLNDGTTYIGNNSKYGGVIYRIIPTSTTSSDVIQFTEDGTLLYANNNLINKFEMSGRYASGVFDIVRMVPGDETSSYVEWYNLTVGAVSSLNGIIIFNDVDYFSLSNYVSFGGLASPATIFFSKSCVPASGYTFYFYKRTGAGTSVDDISKNGVQCTSPLCNYTCGNGTYFTVNVSSFSAYAMYFSPPGVTPPNAGGSSSGTTTPSESSITAGGSTGTVNTANSIEKTVNSVVPGLLGSVCPESSTIGGTDIFSRFLSELQGIQCLFINLPFFDLLNFGYISIIFFILLANYGYNLMKEKHFVGQVVGTTLFGAGDIFLFLCIIVMILNQNVLLYLIKALGG